ncbi:MAG: EFR1 family ferrodoxin [Anaerolineae bacterium]|nr:EFR1 family ferrodoxin [Anaerolineae bacterium]
MNTELFVFSGTGNSLHVAQELQKRLPDTRLRPIVSLLDAGRANAGRIATAADAVGFIFPQYASTMPNVVRTVVQRLDLGSAGYLFAIATRGRTDCFAFHELDALLEKQGRRLDAFFVLTMPSGSAPLSKNFAGQIAPDRVAGLESAMLARLDTIQKVIVDRQAHRDEDIRSSDPAPLFLVPLLPLLRWMTPALIRLGKRVESRFDFYVDDTCTGCGTCEQVCLANRIRLVDRKPQWPQDATCYGCFACLNYCPLQAIQINSTWYLRSYTDQNGRYHHPQVAAEDIAAQKER